MADWLSVSEKLAGRVPVFFRVTVPLTVSPGLMLVRLKIAAPSLLLVCLSEPAVTALMVFPVSS